MRVLDDEEVALHDARSCKAEQLRHAGQHAVPDPSADLTGDGDYPVQRLIAGRKVLVTLYRPPFAGGRAGNAAGRVSRGQRWRRLPREAHR